MLTVNDIPQDISAGAGPLAGEAQQPTLMPAAPAQAQPTAAAPTSVPAFGENPLMRQKMEQAGFTASPKSPASNIFKNANDAAASLTPQEASKPGAWARTLLAGASKAMTSLGDVSTKPTEQTSKVGGFLEGVAETQANENARKMMEKEQGNKQQQQQFENQMAEKKFSLDEQRTAAEIASNNVQKIYQQRLIHQLDTKDQDENVNQGVKRIASNAADGSKTEEQGLTYQQIQSEKERMGQQWVFSHDFQPDGKRIVGKDSEGNDQYATTYTVQTVPEKQDIKDTDMSDFKKWLPEMNLKEGDKLFGSQMQSLRALADERMTTTMARNNFVQKYADSETAGKIQKETVDLGPQWQQALGEHDSDPEATLNSLLQNKDTLTKYPHLEADVKRAYGATEKDPTGQEVWNKMLDRKEKLQEEKMRLATLQRQTDKAQQTMEKQYADRLATNLRARSGGLGLADQQVFNANRLSTLAKQYYDPKTGQYNVPVSKYAELSLGVAGLISKTGAPTEEQVRNITAASLKGDISKALTYITGTPHTGSTQALIKDLLSTIDREGQVAVSTREDYMNQIRGLAPSDLDPSRVERLEKAQLPPYHPIFEEQGEKPKVPTRIITFNGKQYLSDDEGNNLGLYTAPQAPAPAAPAAPAAPRQPGVVRQYAPDAGAVARQQGVR